MPGSIRYLVAFVVLVPLSRIRSFAHLSEASVEDIALRMRSVANRGKLAIHIFSAPRCDHIYTAVQQATFLSYLSLALVFLLPSLLLQQKGCPDVPKKCVLSVSHWEIGRRSWARINYAKGIVAGCRPLSVLLSVIDLLVSLHRRSSEAQTSYSKC